MALDHYKAEIEKSYSGKTTGCGSSFGEILSWEIHINSCSFAGLAKKWGISVSFLGDLIQDHCRNLTTIEVTHSSDERDLVLATPKTSSFDFSSNSYN